MKFTLPLLTVVLIATNAVAAPIPGYGRRASDNASNNNVLVSGPTVDAQGKTHDGTITKSDKTAIVGASNDLTGAQGQVINAREYMPFHGDRTRESIHRPRSVAEQAYIMYERRSSYSVQGRGIDVVGAKVNADGSVEEGKIVDNGLDHDNVIGSKNEQSAAAGSPVSTHYRRGTSVVGPKVHADGSIEDGKIEENGLDHDDVIDSKNEMQENAAAGAPVPGQYRRGTSVVGPKVHADGSIEAGQVGENGLDHDEVVGAEDHVQHEAAQRRGTLVKGPVIDADGTVHEGKVVQIDGPDRVEPAEDHRTGPTGASAPPPSTPPPPPPSTNAADTTTPKKKVKSNIKDTVHVSNHDQTTNHSETVTNDGANVDKGEDAGESTQLAARRQQLE
ncbi:hypothetical protein IE81DRAFT_53192 [Ceraceosorus guamensis]|uniref:Hypervirulence associated protein TUDOR domain-containing protein n=1 Tax=Ceraceosorus guamensis TaxID=1522189 RepID=A0A316W5E6_9BASI|nr:hypothetical protein IE81DRAFT_53192 [Ceraceosorus guamensis]PWN43941.1 hypothetical protein IE81DRAFT_53192 [Ceraceosorus guamensis]